MPSTATRSSWRRDVEGDYMLRWPHHREVIERILSRDLKKLGVYEEAKPGECIELFSSAPLSAGRNGTHGTPEPDALKVIIRVSKYEKSEHGPHFVYWDFFVQKSDPDADRSGEDEQYEILRALHEIGGDGGAFTPAEILAEATGIPVQDLADHLELLEESGKVRIARSMGKRPAAYMEARGRLFLREAAMPKMKSNPCISARLMPFVAMFAIILLIGSSSNSMPSNTACLAGVQKIATESATRQGRSSPILLC
jgi:hypothetical protein